MGFSLVDTFFIGMLGTKPLAAISFCMPVNFILLNFIMGIVIGLSSVLAKTLGTGKNDHAAQITTDNLFTYVLLFVGITLTAQIFLEQIFRTMGADNEVMPLIDAYMRPWLGFSVLLAIPMIANGAIRSTGDMKMPSIIMIISGVVNGILDPFLIFGIGPFPELGMRGAAYATVVSWVFACLVALLVLRRRYRLLNFRISSPSVLWSSCRPVLYIGIPAAITNLLVPMAGAIMTSIIASHGATAVAAFGVGSRIEMLAMIVVMALGAAMTTFVAQNLGAGNTARISESIQYSTRFTIKSQLLIFVLLAVCSPLIARIFSDDEQVIHLVIIFLIILPISYPAQGLSMLIGAIFNALHKPIDAMFLSLLRLFIFYIPLSWLGSQFFDIYGFFIGALLGNLLAGVMAYLWLRRHRQKYMMG